MIIIEEEIWTWMRYNGKLYKGEFQVSNLGNIRSVDRYVNCHSKYGTPYKMFKKGQEISQNIYNGYLQACTSENGKSRNFFVHRAVLGLIPSNFNIVFSAWNSFVPEDTTTVPVAYFDDGEHEDLIDKKAVLCGGDCQHCKKCFYLKPGESVKFAKH